MIFPFIDHGYSVPDTRVGGLLLYQSSPTAATYLSLYT